MNANSKPILTIPADSDNTACSTAMNTASHSFSKRKEFKNLKMASYFQDDTL